MTTGIFLGIVSWLSLLLTWMSFPDSIKRFTVRHPILADVLSSVSTGLFVTAVSKTIVAIVAVAIVGLLVNFTLLFMEKLGYYGTERTN